MSAEEVSTVRGFNGETLTIWRLVDEVWVEHDDCRRCISEPRFELNGAQITRTAAEAWMRKTFPGWKP